MKKSLKMKMLFSILILTTFSIFANLSNLFNITDLYDSIKENVVNQDTTAIDQIHQRTLVNNIGGIIIQILITVLIMFIINKTIIKPAKLAKQHLDELQNDIALQRADLSKKISTNSKDEIGLLIEGINLFTSTLEHIIKTIFVETNSLNQNTKDVLNSVILVNDSSSSISSTTQELAASMEEISASMVDLFHESQNINSSLDEMTSTAINILEYTTTMANRSNIVMQDSTNNKNSIEVTISNTTNKIKQAIDDCKNVEQVDELTNDILHITQQTNLLALNASIEAARAGEAGHGFAVVANEIRELADSSRLAATKIQQTNKTISTAVQNIVGCSKQILELVNGDILSDYDKQLDNCVHYNTQAEYVQTSISDYTKKIQLIKETFDRMNEAFRDISKAMEENTTGVTSVATDTTDLTRQIGYIQDHMDSCKNIAVNLQDETKTFVIT